MLFGSAPARAADDEPGFDEKVMNSIMTGLGFKKDGAAEINYQERAPLVIPPSRELPPPENLDAVTANNPAWPKDPDVARRKKEAAMARNRNVSDEREREQNPLRPDQLTPGGKPTKRQQSPHATTAMTRPRRASAINCRRRSLARRSTACSAPCSIARKTMTRRNSPASPRAPR